MKIIYHWLYLPPVHMTTSDSLSCKNLFHVQVLPLLEENKYLHRTTFSLLVCQTFTGCHLIVRESSVWTPQKLHCPQTTFPFLKQRQHQWGVTGDWAQTCHFSSCWLHMDSGDRLASNLLLFSIHACSITMPQDLYITLCFLSFLSGI